MAFKTFEVEALGTVTVYKRRGTHTIRLTIRSDNSLRVTIPAWMNYASGVEFARNRRDWISKHARPTSQVLVHGQLIGKAHRLQFIATANSSKPSSRIIGNEIRVKYPTGWSVERPEIQQVARRAAIRALRQQAQALLPARLAELAAKHKVTYRSVTIKQLQTRWGSCDQAQHIALNLYLLQLPWELIDYVLLHELTHTMVMQHGPRFWQAMELLEPETQRLRQAIKQYRTIIT